ncbi:protoporphyrinogen oxidase [Rhabdothermincola salaria]|uniref:protoporphyrinogen oxidase n=1 Tax=Rhabdothermincola salaria TaxID=2903142 RepID=UPI001E6503A0|nr:protoporphyrinogen oxidase [Rhabdothermincola salaria]MCD9624794.1 protoporphyrinogen oxidase [Rhabdothermincola salaria]
MSPAPRVVVVGAGITGLTAAFTIMTRTPQVDVTVLEAADRVGGKVLTTPFAGRPVDCGADAFLARVPEAIELCEELGLDTVLTSPARRSALVYSGGALRRLPEGLVLGVPTDLDALAGSGIVSPDAVVRASADVDTTEWLPGEPSGDPLADGDESVGTLVRRRLGDEVFERLVAPLLSGVNAGDADHLSVAAGAAQIGAAARRHPSLVVGLRQQTADARAAGADPEAPVFRGIPVGTQTLTDLLLARLVAGGASVHLSSAVTALDHRLTDGGARSGWTLRTEHGVVDADAVVLAVPAPVAARVLHDHAADAAAGLAELEYASVAMVTLAVPLDRIERDLDASGFLVARGEGLAALTACSWASSKWAHLADPDVAVLRVSAGRHGDTGALELDDPELVRVLTGDLAATMGVDGPPVAARVTRWPDGLPQFRPGHLGRVAAWRDEVADRAPGVVLAGASYDGLGLPACIRQGRVAAADAARQALDATR